MKNSDQYQLPAVLAAKMRRHFPDVADAWIEEFPQTLDWCVEHWGLQLGSITPHMSFNFIVFGHDKFNRQIALKLGVPHGEQKTEIEALRHYNGRGCVECLEVAPQLGALLLRRISPGSMLLEVGDDMTQTEIAAKAMKNLPMPEPENHNLPTFENLLQKAIADVRAAHDPVTDPVPDSLIDLVEQTFEEIQRTKKSDVLLHCDLHHENLLFDEDRGWLAIDPKGVIGAPILEVGRFMHNRLAEGEPEIEKSLRSRSEIISAELGCPAQEVIAGAMMDCALCTCWSVAERSGSARRNVATLTTYARILQE